MSEEYERRTGKGIENLGRGAWKLGARCRKLSAAKARAEKAEPPPADDYAPLCKATSPLAPWLAGGEAGKDARKALPKAPPGRVGQ
jgi:hypothetical protein